MLLYKNGHEVTYKIFLVPNFNSAGFFSSVGHNLSLYNVPKTQVWPLPSEKHKNHINPPSKPHGVSVKIPHHRGFSKSITHPHGRWIRVGFPWGLGMEEIVFIKGCPLNPLHRVWTCSQAFWEAIHGGQKIVSEKIFGQS